MDLLRLPKMAFSAEEGWPQLVKIHPTVRAVFAYVVLPLSLLPPALLYYAGNHYGDSFVAGFAAKPWGAIACAFFTAEMLTFAWMGWFIKQVAENGDLSIDYHDAYMLAAIAPIPLWISSLSLLVPDPIFNGLVSLAALVLSCGLIYQGIHALCHTREDVTAASIVYAVIGAGLAAWALLLTLIVTL